MYTLNDLSPTAKQTRLLSIPFPLWLISLTSFVVAYVLLALVRLVLVLQRQKPERDERYIRLYHQRIMMRDQGRESQIIAGMVLAVVDMPIEVCKTDASAPPPSVFREAEAETVREHALFNNDASNLLLRTDGLFHANNPKGDVQTAEHKESITPPPPLGLPAAQLVDAVYDYHAGQTVYGTLEPPLQFRPRRRTIISSLLQPAPIINDDGVGGATAALVENDGRSFLMRLGSSPPPKQLAGAFPADLGRLSLDLHSLLLPIDELPSSPAPSHYEESEVSMDSNEPIDQNSRVAISPSSSSGMIVQSQLRLTIEPSPSTYFASQSLVNLVPYSAAYRDHVGAEIRGQRPGIKLQDAVQSATGRNGDGSIESKSSCAGLWSIKDARRAAAARPGENSGDENAVDTDNAGQPGATQRCIYFTTRTNCEGHVEVENEKVSGAACQSIANDVALTEGAETRNNDWSANLFAPRSWDSLSTWSDEMEGEAECNGCILDEEEEPREDSMMPGAWLDHEEEREVAELCTRFQDMSLVALVDLLDGEAGMLRGDEAMTAGSGSEGGGGERVAEVGDSPAFEVNEGVSCLVDAFADMKLVIVVESSSLDDTPSLELTDAASGTDLDASLYRFDWRDGDSDCSAVRGVADLLGEDEDYVFRPEGGCTTPVFDPSDEEDSASVISQNLYYDDETGELFFPFVRHTRGHGHASLEPLQRPRYHYADTERSLFVVDECERRPMAETVGFDRRGFVFNPFAEDDDDYFEESILEASGASDGSGIYPASSTDTQPSTDPGTVSTDGTRRTKTRRGCRGGRRGKNRKARRQAALAAGDLGDDIVDPL